MKYFIIYKDNKFIGYTDNKKMLRQFLKIRNDKYKIIKMYDDEIASKIKTSDTFESYALSYYQGYELTTELPIFIYEFPKFEALIREHLITTVALIDAIRKQLEYFKSDDLEKFDSSLKSVYDMCYEFITYSCHEPVYDELLDVLGIFKYLYNIDLIH